MPENTALIHVLLTAWDAREPPRRAAARVGEAAATPGAAIKETKTNVVVLMGQILKLK